MRNLAYFLFCFFLLFGTKVGVVDLSVLVPFLMLPFLIETRMRLSKNFGWLCVMLVLLTSYQVLVQIFNQNIEFDPLGRLLRALLTVVAVGLVVCSGGAEVGARLLRATLYALIFHGVLILIAAWFQPFNVLLAIISGNTRIREGRASGLMAGFDIAGYASILGMAIIVYKVYPIRSYLLNFFYLGLLLLTCYYTSRVSMAFGGILFVIYTLGYFNSGNVPFRYRALGLFIFAIVGFIAAYKVFQILDVTFSLGILDISTEVRDDITSRHAVQDSDSFLWADMFFLPDSLAQTVFGAGSDNLDSDVGYVNEIFRYGVVGLCFTLYFHLRFAFRDSQLARMADWRRPITRLSLFVTISILVLTLKNNYLLVRGIFPIFLIVVGVAGMLGREPAVEGQVE